MRGFSDFGYFHSQLERCFAEDREHPLWRLDNNTILFLSEIPPQVSESFGYAQTKSYDPKIPAGTVLNYRITANPVIKRDGRRVPLNMKRTKNQQYCALDWLIDRLKAGGASALSVNIIENEIRKAKNGKVRYQATTFEGKLVVEDAELFRNILMNGLGHEKAYGCGLLLVRP